MRLLIADDDDYTREGLAETVDWEKYGISQISQARDGEEALRLAAIEHPDIVLTDIRMPKLNGIEFAESLSEASSDSQLLFMSGYMDTSYLKSAIKLSAVDYIEKPIKLHELERGVLKAVKQIEQKNTLSSITSRNRLLESYELAEQLTHPILDWDEIKLMCNRVGFPTNSMYMCIRVRQTTVGGDVGELLEYVLDYWKRDRTTVIGHHADNEGCYAIIAYRKQDSSAVMYLLEQFVHSNIAAGIGRSAESLADIPDSFRTSEQALARAFYRPEHRLFHDKPGDLDQYANITELLLGFFGVLEHSPEELEAYVRKACERLVDMEYPDVDKVRLLFVTFAHAMLAGKNILLLKIDGIFDEADVERYINHCPSIEDVKQFVLLLCRRYADEVTYSAQYSRVVRDTIDYIAAHINEADLDLREIADYVHLSAAHLGTLFKQETGKTIKQYISDYRIELSKKLMANEHYKINTVAELCGYASASYFSKVFKTASGLTPVEYRRQCAR